MKKGKKSRSRKNKKKETKRRWEESRILEGSPKEGCLGILLCILEAR